MWDASTLRSRTDRSTSSSTLSALLTRTRAIRSSRQFFLYALIGASGVLLDLAVFFVLFDLVHLDKFVATGISTTAGITNSFVWNARYNFRVGDRLAQRFVRFYVVGLGGLALTAALFAVFVDALGWDANLVKVLSLAPVLLVQYTANKRWSFA